MRLEGSIKMYTFNIHKVRGISAESNMVNYPPVPVNNTYTAWGYISRVKPAKLSTSIRYIYRKRVS